MGKNIGKNISKNLSGKYSQTLLGNGKKSAADTLKTSSKKVIQKTAEATSDLIGNKIADAVAYKGIIAKVTKNSPQNNSDTVINEHDKEIPKERHLSSVENF